MDATDLKQALEVALEAADAADAVVMGHYAQGFDVRIKEDRTPVTDADLAAEYAIHAVIADAFPDDAFHGEETGVHAGDAGRTWLVDPIDGTKSYVRGYPFFSTQIALMHQGRIVVGVSSAPAFGERAWATTGEGAWLDGERIRVSEVDSVEQATLSLGNLASLARSPAWPALGELVSRVDRVRGYGDFYHYHLLASGRIDMLVESDVNILDIAALSLIVEEAGGRFTDLAGAAVGPDTRSVMASNGALHACLEGLGGGSR